MLSSSDAGTERSLSRTRRAASREATRSICPSPSSPIAGCSRPTDGKAAGSSAFFPVLRAFLAGGIVVAVLHVPRCNSRLLRIDVDLMNTDLRIGSLEVADVALPGEALHPVHHAHAPSFQMSSRTC